MVEIKKILLVVPNNRWDNHKQWNDFPYTVGILTRILKDKYDVKIIDAGFYDMSKEEVLKQIEEYQPDVVGVSCLSLENDENFRTIISLARLACPKTIIIVGGIYPTLLPKNLARHKDVDYVVIGEAEERLLKLLENIEKGKSMEEIDGLAYKKDGEIIVQEMTSFVQDLDDYLPCYDNLNFSDYAHKTNKKAPYIMPRRFPHAQTITSRGCPHHCIFCSSKAINGPKIRYRSAESVLKEIDILVQKYGVKEIVFLDDNFHSNRERLVKILNGLIERNYDLEWKTTNSQISSLDDDLIELIYKSGCYQMSIAVECGTDKSLRLIKKPLTKAMVWPVVKKAKELGMTTLASFIIGIPGQDWEEIRKTGEFAEELDLDYSTFNIAAPLPETELYNLCKEKGYLAEDFSFDNMSFKGFGIPNINTKELAASELLMFRIMEWERINFKTAEKTAKIAKICGLTFEEAEQWREDTRRGVDLKLK